MTGIFRAPVSGDIAVADFAALLAMPAPAEGTAAVVSAPVVGSASQGGMPYTRWVYSSAGWRLGAATLLFMSTVNVVAASNTTEQTLLSINLAQSLIPNLRLFDMAACFGRSGTTDNVTCRVRLGAADPLSALISGSNRSFVIRFQRVGLSTTLVRPPGSQWGVYALDGGPSVGVLPLSQAVAGLTSSLGLALTTQSAGTANTGSLHNVFVWGY